MEKEKQEKQKVIIFAGANSPDWDTEADELSEELEKVGYNIIKIIPINRLDCPIIEYLE